jgi:hypothetical protein
MPLQPLASALTGTVLARFHTVIAEVTFCLYTTTTTTTTSSSGLMFPGADIAVRRSGINYRTGHGTPQMSDQQAGRLDVAASGCGPHTPGQPHGRRPSQVQALKNTGLCV